MVLCRQQYILPPYSCLMGHNVCHIYLLNTMLLYYISQPHIKWLLHIFSPRGFKCYLWQISCLTLEPSGVNCIAVPSLPLSLHKRGVELLLHTVTCQSPHHITAWGESLFVSHVSSLNTTYYMHTLAACRPSGKQKSLWCCRSLYSSLVYVDANLLRNGYKVNTHVIKFNLLFCLKTCLLVALQSKYIWSESEHAHTIPRKSYDCVVSWKILGMLKFWCRDSSLDHRTHCMPDEARDGRNVALKFLSDYWRAWLSKEEFLHYDCVPRARVQVTYKYTC